VSRHKRWAHFNHAILNELPIIPVINKIDLKNANPEAVTAQLQSLFSVDPDEVIKISAKQGINIESVIAAIIKKVPPPPASRDKPLRALLFDSWHDKYRGVVTLVSILDGSLRVGEEIVSLKSGTMYQVRELGVISPSEISTGELFAGQVGYMVGNIRDTRETKIGDVFVHKEHVEELGAREKLGRQVIIPDPKPMVFAGNFSW